MPRPAPDPGTPIEELETPRLLLDRQRLQANCERMQARADELDVGLRPHIKTAKTVPVAERASPAEHGPLTVSTLAEAEHFYEAGFTDLTYAVATTAAKVDRCADLIAGGAELTLIADDPTTLRAIEAAGRDLEEPIGVLIEIDCDGTRGGVDPEEPFLTYLAEMFAEASGVELAGVLTHAGSAYDARGDDELREAAETEREAVVQAAGRLRERGHEVPTVSVGSTPTALSAEDLTGVTEMRPGNYVFFDLYQAGLGVCDVDDVAVTVLAEVIGHRDSDGAGIVDAGSLALSEDRSTAAYDDERDKAHGLVAGLDGQPMTTEEEGEEVLVAETSQEHGLLLTRGGQAPQLRVGDKVRIYPNHSCIAAACHDAYTVLDDGEVVDRWARADGW
jgi:D-serine deaminase-like pyridoxal phosphate-dependent protein